MTLDGDVKKRYEDKIKECGGIDPYTLLPKDLSVDPKDFPGMTVLDIGNYMIQSVSPYTKRSFNAYKSTEAYSFFESGFVLNVGSKKRNDLVILVGRVKHSQRMNETPLKAWILASMNGKIQCAHCNCTAGLSETCSHVAAICFSVSNIGESRETKSVTDMLCKWNMPSFKDVSMSSVKEIQWRYPSQETKKHESNFLKSCNSIEPFSDDQIDQFIKKCHSDGDFTALGTIIIPSDFRRKTNIKDEIFLASLYNVKHINKSLFQLIEIGKSISLKITKTEAEEISKITLNKEKSKFFVGLRRGRISGSNFKNCCVTSVENPSLATINCIMNPKNLNNVPSITYQSKNRKLATGQYIRKATTEHENFECSPCGLIINPRLPYFVGSPTGIISCSCHGKGCLEMKCLKILESSGSFEVLTHKPHNILNERDNIYFLEESHEHYYQVQLQLNVMDLDYCDLVFWSPKDFLSVRVVRDVQFWDIAMKKAITFHEEVVMPELLGKFYTKNFDPEINNETEELTLIGLEIEILCSSEDSDLDRKLIGLEIEILHSEEDERKDGNARINKGDNGEQQTDDDKNQTEEINMFVSNNQQPTTNDSFTNVRNLTNHTIEEILVTFSEHEDKLKQIYGEHIKKPKRNYTPKDLPELVALDIVSEKQFQEMAVFAESKLALISKKMVIQPK